MEGVGKNILAVESSCDETAVAILRGRSDLPASLVSSQMELHARFGGVVPEIASRNHLLAAPALVEEALKKAGMDLSEIDAFAATTGPGLAAALMIGVALAKGLALASGKPYVAVNHMEGHLLSPFFGQKEIPPHLSLIISGGHTLIVNVGGACEYQIMGRTVDDAAGEAFDKVAKLIGLGYPGGPLIEQMARDGDPKRYDLPRGMRHSGDFQFSFSGLKTAVRYLLEKEKEISTPDLCASFQEAVVEVLVEKTIAAAKAASRNIVAISGGVSCNNHLRERLRVACATNGMEFRFAEPWLCTDNAAMIAYVASIRLEAGGNSDVCEDITPNFSVF